MYYDAQIETRRILNDLTEKASGTIAEQSALVGVRGGEPLLVIMDALLRYAKAHRRAYDSAIADDGFASEPFLDMLKGCRAMLNMQGGVALELGRSTDSKDNGSLESLFWVAMKAGGYTEADL